MKLVQSYLFLYNLLQCFGWSMLLYKLALEYAASASTKRLYAKAEWYLLIFQTAAVMEVVHCALRLVRSGVFLTAMQVTSRLVITWGIVYSVPETRTQVGAAMFLMAWSVTEVIRYSYYCFSIVGTVPGVLQWCRYTFFIVLYPIGVSGELLSVYAALEPIRRRGLYSVPLPNTANMSFDYATSLVIFMLNYIPVFPQLYMHMFSQRKKVLWAEAREQKAK